MIYIYINYYTQKKNIIVTISIWIPIKNRKLIIIFHTALAFIVIYITVCVNFDLPFVFFDDPNRGNIFTNYYKTMWEEVHAQNLKRAMENIGTGIAYDTDDLARFLYHNYDGSPKLNQVGIDFRPTIRNPGPDYQERMSRIARFVRQSHSDWFYEGGPGNTRITPLLVESILNMKRNVPNNF